MTGLNFRHFAHIIGGQYYDDFIKKDIPAEHLVGKFDMASFLLCDDYPVLVEPSRENVHYHNFNQGHVDDDFYKKWGEEITAGFNNGFDFLMFADGQLVATDRMIYAEHWCSQPMSMYGKMASFLYLIVALPFKGGMAYFMYPLRTKAGGKFLELYHGRFWSEKGTFNDFGLGVLANLIRLAYGANEFGMSGLRKCFAQTMPEDLKSYQIRQFMAMKEGGTLW